MGVAKLADALKERADVRIGLVGAENDDRRVAEGRAQAFDNAVAHDWLDFLEQCQLIHSAVDRVEHSGRGEKTGVEGDAYVLRGGG